MVSGLPETLIHAVLAVTAAPNGWLAGRVARATAIVLTPAEAGDTGQGYMCRAKDNEWSLHCCRWFRLSGTEKRMQREVCRGF
jgi:hypothetical protein